MSAVSDEVGCDDGGGDEEGDEDDDGNNRRFRMALHVRFASLHRRPPWPELLLSSARSV